MTKPSMNIRVAIKKNRQDNENIVKNVGNSDIPMRYSKQKRLYNSVYLYLYPYLFKFIGNNASF